MVQPDAEKPENASRNNRRVVFGCIAGLAVMTAITAVSPKLYSMFCQVTGYGGTTQRVEANAGKVLDRVFTVRFDGNVASHLPWKFEPDVTTMKVKIGETRPGVFPRDQHVRQAVDRSGGVQRRAADDGALLQED